LAEALVVDLNNDAEASARDEQSRNPRELDAAAISLRELTRMVLEAEGVPLDRWREALFERIPREESDEAVQKIDAMAMPSDAKPYRQLRKRWRSAKRLFIEIATRVKTAAAPNGEPVRRSVEHLKSVPNWAHAPMRDAPTTAIPKAWRPYVLDENERVVDPKAYVFSIIDAWRTAIKRRDVFTEPRAGYGDPRRGLLEDAAWAFSQRGSAGCSIALSMPTSRSRVSRGSSIPPTASSIRASIRTRICASRWSMASRKSSSRRSIN
jgi:hypothetical protein